MSKATQQKKLRKEADRLNPDRPHPCVAQPRAVIVPVPSTAPRISSWVPDVNGGDQANLRFWVSPRVGDIVHCKFPDFLSAVLETHERKTRPALVVGVQEFANGKVTVKVAYGTSQLGVYAPGQFVVHAADIKLGLVTDTLFDMRKVVPLPFDTEWFSPNPEQTFGLHPKKGRLDLENPAYRDGLNVAIEDAKRLGSLLDHPGPHAHLKPRL